MADAGAQLPPLVLAAAERKIARAPWHRARIKPQLRHGAGRAARSCQPSGLPLGHLLAVDQDGGTTAVAHHADVSECAGLTDSANLARRFSVSPEGLQQGR